MTTGIITRWASLPDEGQKIKFQLQYLHFNLKLFLSNNFGDLVMTVQNKQPRKILENNVFKLNIEQPS